MLRKTLYWIIPILTLIACNNQLSTKEKEYLATADSTSFSSDISPLSSPSRKRIRTADIKCRVTNVLATTNRLEQLITRLDGIIAESHLENELSQTKEFNYKSDSIKRVQLYTPTAHLTLKMPVKSLDSVVYVLSNSADFISYRTLKQEDATFRYLSNALKNEAVTSNDISSKESGKKKLEVIQYDDDKQERVIDRRIENLKLLDDVEYATFTVQLFQPDVADVSVVVNPATITRAGFGAEIVNAMRNGIELLRGIILFFIQVWPLWIIAFVGWIGYRRLYRPIQKMQRN